MKNTVEAWKARYKFDAYLGRLHRATRNQPERVWIREVREALEINAKELAKRMGIRQSTLSALERSEAAGGIKLSNLRKAAEAMNCRLVYAIVPKGGSLERSVSWDRSRARLRAKDEADRQAWLAARKEGTPPVSTPKPKPSVEEIMALADAVIKSGGRGPVSLEPAEADMSKLSNQELLAIMQGEAPVPPAKRVNEKKDDDGPPPRSWKDLVPGSDEYNQAYDEWFFEQERKKRGGVTGPPLSRG